MGMLRQILKDTAIISISNTTSFFLGFLIIITMVNFLGPYQFGIFSLVMSIMTIATLVLDLGLSKLIISEASRPTEKNSQAILNAYSIIQILLSTIIGTLTIAFSNSIAILLGKQIQTLLVLLGALIVLVGIKNTIITSLQTKIHFIDYSKFLFLDSLIRLFLVYTLLAFLDKKVEYALLGYVITEVIVTILYLKEIPTKKVNLEESKKNIRKLVEIIRQHGKWGFAISILRSIESALPLWIIQTTIGTTAVGIYSALLKIQTAIIRLFEPLETTLYPIVSKFYETKDSDKIIYRATKYLLYLSIPITIFCLIFAEQIIESIIGKEFAENSNVFRLLILVLPIFILNIPQKPFLFTMKAQKQLAIIAIVLLTFTITIGTTMTIYFGLIGIAISELIKFMMDIALKISFIKKIANKKFTIKELILPDNTDKEIIFKILKVKN